eukprot:CAMPEP_0197175566 /NCGR_PEP_ID=MMETSP1423-20130617/1752_1 /TAXON_ID=476441 /ORGANISM="Pseudo-nitzschia heimii, Strain UNC1101" /LENGTH=682 /DNA_ID=CAMNT_0042624755 /DNA_START=272 /DNA_END=2320 /DNA_ORIENTATION=-
MRVSSVVYSAFLMGAALAWRAEGFVPQSASVARHGSASASMPPHVLRDSVNGVSSTTDEEEEVEKTVVEPSSSETIEPSTTKEVEKTLREALNERNSKVEDEGKYAVVDGTGMDTDKEDSSSESSSKDAPFFVDDKDSSSSSSSSSSSEEMSDEVKMLERLIKKRPYPLFLAEKGVEIVEDIFKPKPKIDEYLSLVEPGTGDREKVVVLGTGWGGAAYLKDVDPSKYDVTVISPRNYFVFTPMLSGASVGTVDFRSITEPIREINRYASYLEATATDVDPDAKILTCQSVVCDGNSCEINEFSVPYDRLVVTIGAQTNTFGIPGVREHCNFLKQVEDARRIRTSIVNCFERANLPDMSEEERINNLTFAVIGAGPTGIEFAAELRDFVEQDGPKYYPKLLKYVRIKVIEASPTVLAPFDKSLQEEAIAQMNRNVEFSDPNVYRLLPERFKLVELLLNSSVKEVTSKQILLNDGNVIDYGLAVWAAGNGPLPLTLQIVDAIGDAQSEEQNVARGRLVTDPWMRVKGSNGSILAFGDCSCITHGPDGPLPATGQVAAQQGEYLAKLMNKGFELSPSVSEAPPVRSSDHASSLSESIAGITTGSTDLAKPFQFLNLGILAYTGGGSALAQVSTTPSGDPIKGRGAIGNALWNSIYISKQISWRNRLMVLNDWTRRKIFGRDITRL